MINRATNYISKIIDYDIISALSMTSLIDKVKEKIKDGWEPRGTFTVDSENYYQVIVKVKYEDISPRWYGGPM